MTSREEQFLAGRLLVLMIFCYGLRTRIAVIVGIADQIALENLLGTESPVVYPDTVYDPTEGHCPAGETSNGQRGGRWTDDPWPNSLFDSVHIQSESGPIIGPDYMIPGIQVEVCC